MAKIAILGFGTVGSGVYEVLCRNAAGVSRRAGEPVEVKYILDPKDFSDHPAAQLFIKNFDAILEDPEVKVVVETIGGTRFAYPYVKACLESGRSVCTSNKEMVATYGAELLALARAHNCAFLFEASVGGGTPIITPMHQCLAANVITEVEGIVNGTTNFMLTKMVRENLSFDEALKIAQELGYAETKDPGDDVDGRDACRKIAILSSLVCGHQIFPQNIPTRGIRDITVDDVAAAEKLGCVIKLISWMKRGEDGSVAAGVEPCLVPRQTSWPVSMTSSMPSSSRAICWATWSSTARARASCPPPVLSWPTWWTPSRTASRSTTVCSGSPPSRWKECSPTPLPPHTMCVWKASPRRWPRPSTARAMWWKSISTAAPTLWTAPTARLWPKQPAR